MGTNDEHHVTKLLDPDCQRVLERSTGSWPLTLEEWEQSIGPNFLLANPGSVAQVRSARHAPLDSPALRADGCMQSLGKHDGALQTLSPKTTHESCLKSQ
jgi:hypothetical protein